KKKYPDLLKWFCIETIEVCCSPGTHGPDCLTCLGGSERPCYGNGFCSGDGTRGGDGSCRCKAEYTGQFCLECADGYYTSERNDTHSVCTVCHEACKTCHGSTNKDCKNCQDGWVKDDGSCVDIDECQAEESPCMESQYCVNTEGSFSCKTCDGSCSGCTGEGPDNCKTCTSGYELEDETCTDLNECNFSEKVCLRDNEDCVNTPGSYTCICAEGFEEDDEKCVEVLRTEEAETVEEETEKLTSELKNSVEVHEDL
ncbi:hypothetical protein FKM82_012764, partial [Ascaphus truei]